MSSSRTGGSNLADAQKPMRIYGWRKKIGLLVPSTNYAMEFEFNKLAPSGVSICAARLKVEGNLNSVQDVVRMAEEQTEKAAIEVADAGVNLIVYGCTSGSFVRGLEYDKALTRRIEDLTGIPAVTTSTSVMEALREMKLRSIALVTPYSEDINRLEAKFLSDSGFRVANLISGVLHTDQMTPSVACKRAIEANNSEADGVFISCTSFQTIYIIGQLEKNIRKPVVSSNQASIWYAFKRLRISDAIVGFGRLLETPR